MYVQCSLAGKVEFREGSCQSSPFPLESCVAGIRIVIGWIAIAIAIAIGIGIGSR